VPEDPRRLTIRLESPAFADGAAIPKDYTCDGKDVSPPLAWSGAPGAARSLALICEDPDAPSGTWTHWVIFNIPAAAQGLKEGIPAAEQVDVAPGGNAARQGKNDFGKVGYGGPCPPGGTHRYFFRIYALDTQPDLGAGATKARLVDAMKGHLLAEGRLMGTYSR
jgi:Raf kinase inhibitor-like YbhB/YbcL family protein